MYTTIDAENTKYYRKAMDVVVSVESYASSSNGKKVYGEYPVDWTGNTYANGKYNANFRAGQVCKSVPILMDLANGGFYNNGQAEPIKEADLKNGSGYGVVSANVAQDNVLLSFVTGTGGGYIPAKTVLRACARDSKGNKYYVSKTLASSDVDTSITYYRWRVYKSDISGFPANERLYIEYCFAGEVLRFANDELIDCTVNLRSVETKLADPELQMSEIEFNAYCPKTRTKLNRIVKGTIVKYSAGYVGDMSHPRTFYTNARITQNKQGVINATGYDATEFLTDDFDGWYASAEYEYKSVDYLGTVSAYPMLLLGSCVWLALNKKGRDLDVKTVINTNLKKPTSYSQYYIQNKDTIAVLFDKTPIRTQIANTCNILRAPDKGFQNKGLYVDYVDAGYPIANISNSLYSKTLYAKEGINLGNGARTITADFMSDYDESYDEIYKTYKLPNYAVGRYNLQSANNHEVTIKAKSSVWIELNDEVSLSWGVTDSNLSIIETTPYKALVKNTSSSEVTAIVYSYPIRIEGVASSPFTTRKAGGYGTHIFPGIYANFEAYQDTTYSTTKTASCLDSALDNIKDRDPRAWTFTWRGDPRIQPRDRIEVAVDASSNDKQLLTIDTITLEHSNGGLTSEIVGRLGKV